MSNRTYLGFGEYWQADITLEPFDLVEAGDPAVAITVTAGAPPWPRAPLRSINRGHVYADGLHLPWRDEVAFDLIGSGHICYQPGPDWAGILPPAFFSSVAAFTLAWRGALALHASAVDIDGRAVLIAGRAGAGKSTLTAQLLGLGGRLIGDDLTVIDMPDGDRPFMVRRGRRSIRLHQDMARLVAAGQCEPVDGDSRGKWLVTPIARCAADAVPVAAMILLGGGDGLIAPRDGARLLGRQFFRPRWMRALPGHAARLQGILALAARMPIHGIMPEPDFYRDDRLAMAILRIMPSHR